MMKAERFRTVVGPDGRVQLPPGAAERAGVPCGVIVLFDDDPCAIAEGAVARVGLAPVTDEEIERIVHEVRGVA